MTHARTPTPARHRSGFTLLEMMIVMGIVALILGAVHTITQGTLVLADDIGRAQRQDSRHQAFTTFCDRLFGSLPASAALNLKTTGNAGQYLSNLELHNVPSPFDGLPGRVVTLYTESTAGGSLRLKLDCRLVEEKEPYASVVLFEDLGQCEWRAFDPGSNQWTGVWEEPVQPNIMRRHPFLLELSMNAPGTGNTRRVFWIAPNTQPRPPQPIGPDGLPLQPGASGQPGSAGQPGGPPIQLAPPLEVQAPGGGN